MPAMTKKQFSRQDVVVTTFATCDDAVKERFQQWALSLDPELDGECGADASGAPLPESAYLWVLKHSQSASCQPGGVYQTFIFLDRQSGEFLATGSIVPDDRDVASTYGIEGQGFWGFLNIRRDLRGRGLGTLVSAYMDEHVQRYVDALGRPCSFSLFTRNEHSRVICQALGFQFVRQIFVAAFAVHEDLYTKTYVPGQTAARATGN